MFCFEYEVKNSPIDIHGKGVFAVNDIPAGKVLTAPDKIDAISLFDDLPEAAEATTSVRWYEDMCMVPAEWTDENYFNHSFSPNSLWHLGFVIALRDIRAGEEVTLDYRHLLGDGFVAFTDSATGREVKGPPIHPSLFTLVHPRLLGT